MNKTRPAKLSGTSTTHPHSALAASRFKCFKPSDEGVQPVRQSLAPSVGDVQRLRQLREMFLSMPIRQVLEAMEWHPDLTAIEALSLAKETGRLVVPSSIHDRFLLLLNGGEYSVPFYSAWTGTMVIQESPGVLFADSVVSNWAYRGVTHTITFTVPDKFRGKKDCALMVNYPDFELVARGNNEYELRVVDGNYPAYVNPISGADYVAISGMTPVIGLLVHHLFDGNYGSTYEGKNWITNPVSTSDRFGVGLVKG